MGFQLRYSDDGRPRLVQHAEPRPLSGWVLAALGVAIGLVGGDILFASGSHVLSLAANALDLLGATRKLLIAQLAR